VSSKKAKGQQTYYWFKWNKASCFATLDQKFRTEGFVSSRLGSQLIFTPRGNRWHWNQTSLSNTTVYLRNCIRLYEDTCIDEVKTRSAWFRWQIFCQKFVNFSTLSPSYHIKYTKRHMFGAVNVCKKTLITVLLYITSRIFWA
jgi:hypothetical protein